LQTQKDSKIFKKSNSLLDGTNGIAYLLFVGRNNYAANIQDLMTDTLFADKSNVNQIIHKLTASGKDFLISKGTYRKKGVRGRARSIYTANNKPITGTLKRFNISFEETELSFALNQLGETSDFFPKYLTNTFQTFLIRKMPWHTLLSIYFFYLSEIMRCNDFIVYPMPANFQVSKEKIHILLEKYPSIRKDLTYLFTQLGSPMLGLNPEFKAHIEKAMEQLNSKDSEMMTFLDFLKALQKEGITDFSVLESQVKEVMTVYARIDEIKAKLKVVDNKLEKIDKSNAPTNQ
jgi:cell fate (sporulation/competence/biofilm development) regulator YmcA (YheA/YmcA/DUF963 family)